MNREIKNTVSVIGLGHLGLPLAISFALSDFKVIAMDIDIEKVKAINNFQSPIKETGLNEVLLLSKVQKNLRATTNMEETILNSKASFIVVNTPSNDDGSYGLNYVKKAVVDIGNAIAQSSSWHVVVLVSTVSPKDCETHVIPALESSSGKMCGKDFGFVHNPEFIALGTVLDDMLHPDFRVIGEYDKQSGDVIEEIYKQVSDDPIVRMNISDAELVKIALNCFLTVKISFANTIAEISRKLGSDKPKLVLDTLGLDKRISSKFLSPGLGYGGPCFPRDDKALVAIANSIKGQAYLSEASSKVNKRQVSLVIERIKKIQGIKTITIFGLSYKPDVPYIEESQAFEITKMLADDPDYNLTIYDPQAMDNAREVLENRVKYASSAEEALNSESDLILVLTPWKEFSKLDFKERNVINLWE
ncbi:MAG: nucleotide sugar dehydrogenase [Candidatus Hodarchaeales archaeon]